jgi:hypothetical protein
MRRSLAPKKILAALNRGDATPLIQFHQQLFGTATMMADDDDKGGDDADDAGDDDDDADAGSADDADGKKDDKQDPRVKQLSDENAKRRNEAKALKKQNDELAAKLKAIEDKDKSELDKATGTAAELQAKAEKQEKELHDLRIQNAFLSDNKHTWQNPKAALRLADLSKVEIDDEGEVTGLREALDALAKSDPYLLAKDDDDDDDQPPTGQPVGKKPKGNPSRDKLLDKYPALRR